MKGFDNFYRIIIWVWLIENYFTQNKK
jgi:hypothetical protein